MCHCIHISALPSDLDQTVGVVNRSDHDTVISEQGEEEVLLTLGTPSAHIDSIIAATGSRGGNVNVEAIAKYE